MSHTTRPGRWSRMFLTAAATLGLAAAAAVGLDRGPISHTGGGPSPRPEPTTPAAIGYDLAGGDVPPGAAAPANPRPRGRYHTLLRQFAVPADRESYGDFHDYGYYAGSSYAGHTDLPPGYWVYLSPNWYIFQSAPGEAPAKASFSPEQMIGKPDTPDAGDLPTAWASASADGQREWIELTYAEPVEAVAVLVYETYNPGAVDRVTAYAKEELVDVWQGIDPTDPSKPKGVSVIAFKTPVKTNRVRVHLDSVRVRGWNEIDAVGLLAADGTTQWATGATASSAYGRPTTAEPPRTQLPAALRLVPGKVDMRGGTVEWTDETGRPR